MDQYALFLRREYGDDILEFLNKRKHPRQFKRKDYEEVIEKYKL